MAEWLAAGLSRRRLQALVRAGALVRIRYGVYATAPAVREAERDPRFRHAVQVAAARAVTGRNSVASHQSAARMHGIDLLGRWQADQVTLTRSVGGRRQQIKTTGIVLRAADLPAGQVTRYRGVPVTTVARTVVDLARTSSVMAGVVAMDHALYRDKTTKPEIAAVLTGHPKNWPGAAKARKAMGFADHRAESVLESCARVVFAEHHLPAPELQVDLGGDRYVGRVDFYWPEYCTVAEADGEIKYQGKADALAQLERDQRLRAAGFRVVHFTWQQLFREQTRVIGWIRQAFRGEIG